MKAAGARWRPDRPNARFWVLKLIRDSFHPGDKLVETSVASADLSAQAFLAPTGRRLLLVNKRNREISVSLPDAATAAVLAVDTDTADNPARQLALAGATLKLEPFAVAVVSW